jgi:hypothetical protein
LHQLQVKSAHGRDNELGVHEPISHNGLKMSQTRFAFERAAYGRGTNK